MAKTGVVTVCCFAVAGIAGLVRAEEHPFPGIGSRVRVHSLALKSVPLVGTLTAVDQISLTVGAQGGREPRLVMRQDISRLERSVRPGRKGKWAGLGFGAGFVLGFAGIAALDSLLSSGGDSDSVLAWGSIYGVAVGGAGAVVGALVAPGEQWAEVPMDLVRSGDGRKERSTRVQLTILPLVDRRLGIRIVASF